jgi:flavin reductase (DIM6/NTAB) family NADH-FMN oxidoreductase RutF
MAERSAFLAALRGVAHSVAVVTTDGATGRHGATVTSFCSVSADPPSLLVCLRADSRIARAVTVHGVYCVNVLRDSANALAERFAGRGSSPADRFDGVELQPGGAGPPVLAAASCAFSCRLSEAVRAGSHVIAIGLVLEVRACDEPPLAYLDGRYASLTHHPPFAPR